MSLILVKHLRPVRRGHSHLRCMLVSIRAVSHHPLCRRNFPFGELRRACAGARILEHDDLPIRADLVRAQDVEIAVITFELEIVVIEPVPLVDVGENGHDPVAETQPAGDFHPVATWRAVDSNVHLSNPFSLSLDLAVYGSTAATSA